MSETAEALRNQEQQVAHAHLHSGPLPAQAGHNTVVQTLGLHHPIGLGS